MNTDLTTDSRLLEDVHRLQRTWVGHSEVAGDHTEIRVVRKLPELVVCVVLLVCCVVLVYVFLRVQLCLFVCLCLWAGLVRSAGVGGCVCVF